MAWLQRDAGKSEAEKIPGGKVLDVFDTIHSAIMTIDRDFNVTYVNEATRALFAAHAETFKTEWPTLNPQKIVGSCIDVFYKRPEHQRKILADASKLPYRTEITVGDLKISLNVNGLFDAKGQYVGNVLEWTDVSDTRLNEGMLVAINKAMAVIEFTTDGKVTGANENFLKTLGYSLEEIQGQHHSLFVDPVYRASADYKSFWQKLARGEYDAGQYKRIGKGGKEIWIQASYNPILDADGKVFKVVKYATEITEQKLALANFEGQLNAIGKAQAVIEFDLTGKVLNANENFLKTLGYSLNEIQGQHHSLFVDSAYRQSPEYRVFWEKLARGEYDAGQYKRMGKGGKEVWIQASYNPILDLNGRPFKVVKYATDITSQVEASQLLQMAVKQTQEAVGAAKQNDLTQRIPLDGKAGEIEMLCVGVNSLLDTMSNVVSEIKLTAHEVSSASAEISTSTTDLSQRTEEQAASLEETSASMEEISSTVKKNAENAQRANELTASSRAVADKGGEVVSNAVTAMARIEESSRKIVDIIGVIDEIARQTNLLALNAAVEAARAGDAGRGFAVVASEVRSLAQRSSQAAKDIKDLITHSSSQVQDGVGLVNQAGASLAEIVGSIKQVAEIVGDIANASAEQSDGINQINKALGQMDEVTQQNSALVEENAAAAKALEQQAQTMRERVAVFKVGSESESALATKSVERPSPAIKAAPAAVRAAAKPVARGPVARLQNQVATAFKQEPDWKEF